MSIVYNHAKQYYELIDAHKHVVAQSTDRYELLEIKLDSKY